MKRLDVVIFRFILMYNNDFKLRLQLEGKKSQNERSHAENLKLQSLMGFCLEVSVELNMLQNNNRVEKLL